VIDVTMPGTEPPFNRGEFLVCLAALEFGTGERSPFRLA
jgi:hypothetical protein